MTEADFNWELGYWRVDEAIECLSVSDTTRRALMSAMPDAYDIPFRETPPEPDADPQYKLAAVWDRLDPETRKDVTKGIIQYHAKIDEIRKVGQ
jgi:hypothetical protein